MRLRQSRSMARNARIISILVVLFLLSVMNPVSSHPAADMGGSAPGQFDNGMPVYWPCHALLISIVFILLPAGSL